MGTGRLPGRGRSDWLTGPGPDAGYNVPQYVLDSAALLAQLGAEQVDWIGTSMGGLIGMALAEIPGTFLDLLAGYVGVAKEFDSIDELQAYLQTLYAGFGDLTHDQWRHLAEHSRRDLPNGKLALAQHGWRPRDRRPRSWRSPAAGTRRR